MSITLLADAEQIDAISLNLSTLRGIFRWITHVERAQGSSHHTSQTMRVRGTFFGGAQKCTISRADNRYLRQPVSHAYHDNSKFLT